MITPAQLAKSGSEHGEQAALFCFANQNLDTYPDLKWLFAIPNGFYGVQQKAKMKAEGLKAGIPDTCLLVRRGIYASLWIELKTLKRKPKDATSKGGVSDEQSEWLAQARKCGHGAMVCYGWEHARDMLIQYLEL